MVENPRVRGIREQLERSRLFYGEALSADDPTDSFRRLIASVYFGRAALEVMRESAKLGELQIDVHEFDRQLAEVIPRYRLIHAIRIRDFHRFAVMGPGHIQLEHKVSVPPLGEVLVQLYPDPVNPRLSITTSDGSRDYQFLMTSGDLVQDERESEPVPLRDLMRDYLAQLPRAIDRFVSLQRSPDRS